MTEVIHRYIGAVSRTKATDLTEKSIVWFDGEYRSLAAIAYEGNKVRLRFNWLSQEWDRSLTTKESVRTLSTYRITGIKEGE